MTNPRPFFRERWPWLLAVFAIVALRDVSLWTSPRFWAEEARFYYQLVFVSPWPDALVACPQGYYNLACRVGTALALLLPVEHAPLATTAVAFVVQILPALLVLRLAHRGAWGALATTIAVAAVLFAVPMHETWLTTTGSAYHFVLAGAIVIVCHEALALGRLAPLLTLATGLSSGFAMALLPVAGWLAWRRPSRGRFVVLAALAIAIGVQVVAFTIAGGELKRGVGVAPDVAIAAFTTKVWVLPMAGSFGADWIGVHLQWYLLAGAFWWWAPIVVLPTVLAWVVVARCDDANAFAALVCGHALAVMALLTGLGDKMQWIAGDASGRYFLAVNGLHALAMVLVARSNAASWRRTVAALFVAASIVQGVAQYVEHPAHYFTGPDWRTEVAAWRRDPSHRLAVWPVGDDWKIALPR